MPTLENSNETIWAIFKHCEYGEFFTKKLQNSDILDLTKTCWDTLQDLTVFIHVLLDQNKYSLHSLIMKEESERNNRVNGTIKSKSTISCTKTLIMTTLSRLLQSIMKKIMP